MKWSYYNEIDPFAAEWLRDLIRNNLIPQGEVDERSIADVQPADVREFVQCHWFAGVAGWSLALRLAGWPDDRPAWTGSCPCQPFSDAGKQRGHKDERHLWPEMFRLVRECKPAKIIGEQVEGAIRHGWLDGVFADLERENYTCGAVVLGAHSVGKPHIRQRLFWLADAGRDRNERRRRIKNVSRTTGDSQGEARKRQWSGNAAGDSITVAGLADAEYSDTRGGESAVEGFAELGSKQSKRGLQSSRLADLPRRGFSIVRNSRIPRDGGNADDGDSIDGMGNASESGLQRLAGHGDDGNKSRWIATQSTRPITEAGDTLIPCLDGKTRRTQSGIPPLAHGIPRKPSSLLSRLAELGIDPKDASRIFREARHFRVGALKGFGNAIVPQVAAEFIASCMEILK